MLPNTNDLAKAPGFYAFWGKSLRGSPKFHRLPYHLLDVAAVVRVYLRQHPTMAADWSTALGMSRPQFEAWVAFLAALHDSGKFTEGFQNLAPGLLERLQGRHSQAGYGINHVVAGALGMRDVLRPHLIHRWKLGIDWDDDDWQDLLRWWEAPFVGHHGAPAALGGKTFAPADGWDDAGKAALLEMADVLIELFDVQSPIPTGLPCDEALRSLKAASWRMAGFAVLCDWIASSEDWFHRVEEEVDVATYWSKALHQADRAVAASHILPSPAKPPLDTRAMFGWDPRPSQRASEASTWTPNPTLYILEDLTGSGKTEAALLLAHRAIHAGAADGFYFGLPTMATANAMHSRMRDSLRHIFENAAEATLAHSRTRAHQKPFAPDDSAIQAGAWLSEGPKRALLAQVSVGTLDQALLAVLAVRHQALRLFALSSKVLIVDEVHAYDPYATELLATLLRFHASAGGSAILLSATMPMGLRQKLARAFAEGMGAPQPSLRSMEYPLLTRVGASQQPQEDSIKAVAEATRRVDVRMLESLDEAKVIIRRAHAEGKACCWIRNTVADAMEAHASLHELDPILFHARFLPDDRDRIEKRVLAAAGKTSGPQVRRALVVIATQVVEQSLDLDFDEMVTDLAPIDLLVQRAGRLRRHARSTHGSPGAHDERGTMVLHVLAPPWTDAPGERWFTETFSRAAFVYPSHDKLWLTHDVLRREGALDLPTRARALIESVYGDDADARVPSGLHGIREKNEGNAIAQRSQAKSRILKLAYGYAEQSGDWESDAHAATRDGEPTRRLYLARREGTVLRPILGEDWDRGYVLVRASRVAPDPLVTEARDFLPDRGEWHVLAELHPDGDAWLGAGQSSSGKRVGLRYSHILGLEFINGEATHVQPD